MLRFDTSLLRLSNRLQHRFNMPLIIKFPMPARCRGMSFSGKRHRCRLEIDGASSSWRLGAGPLVMFTLPLIVTLGDFVQHAGADLVEF